MTKIRKREVLYKNWNVEVHDTIRMEVVKNTQGSNALYSKILKDLQYIEYLKYVNKYGHVFNDIFDKKNYDPFNKIDLKSKLIESNLRDSTNIYQRKLEKENLVAEALIKSDNFTEAGSTKNTPIHLAKLSVKNSSLQWKKWSEEDENNVESQARLKSR